MIDVFLSASVPLPNRNRAFFETADVLLIREAIKSLVEVVLPVGRLTCGGHPAITPLIELFVRDGAFEADRVTIYQSAFFSGEMPEENKSFVDVRIVPAVGEDRHASLTAMRREMIASRSFDAAVIIGGMEGIFEEWDIFTHAHPNAPVLPIASTGAAAATVYSKGEFAPDLANDLTYSSLFRRQIATLNGSKNHKRGIDG